MNKQRMLDFFFELVQIDSESRHEGAVCAYVFDQLIALGLSPCRDEAGLAFDSDGYNIYATLSGTLPGEPLLLVTHLDTVAPGNGICPVLCEDGFIRSTGNTILAADDKAAVAALFEAIRVLQEEARPHRTIQLVFTISEEIGLLGAKHLDYSKLIATQAVVIDSAGVMGRIITQAPGQLKLRAVIHGRAAHAGIAPEKGISAIQVAAHAVSQMNLLRIDAETTANIGTFVAQGEDNIVPAQVTLGAEIRSLDPQKLKAQADHMRQCLEQACTQWGATLELAITEAYVGYQEDVASNFIQRIVAATQQGGMEPILTSTGGGSDANILQTHGIHAVVVGTGAQKTHSVEEMLSLTAFHQLGALTLALMCG